MYGIVASDMDETFLDHSHRIPDANAEAIRVLRDLGVLFVPASGRAYGSVMQSLAPIACLIEGSYVISYNGGCIHRVGEDAPLTSSSLEHEAVETLFERGKAEGLGIHAYTLDGTCWGWDLPDEELSYLRGHMEIARAPRDDVSFLAATPIAKVLFVKPNDLPHLASLLDRMKGDLPEVVSTLSTTFSSNRYLEFNPSGVDKGSGLRELARITGVPLERTIAVGDSANDLAMVRAAGVGVAVSNATPDVFSAADYRARSSCDDGVIAEILHELVLR
jgi:Cof subfamily protein (haloacid dehalogenase superfamily)